jgi:plasmid maintenance system antidote protein VapI
MKTNVLNLLVDKSGIKREDVANGMGVTRMQLYRLLSNPSRMRVEQMIRLASILKKSPRYMITLIKNI